jgi:hypothetical protein
MLPPSSFAGAEFRERVKQQLLADLDRAGAFRIPAVDPP